MNFLNLGFETCGNATIIAYENGAPIVATDPWILGRPYFGSWAMPYKMQDRQVEAIKSARFIWMSHGHPDHLNQESLDALRHAIFLIPAHCNKRILNDLTRQGVCAVEVRTNEWLPLSANVKIMTFPDWNQDAACILAIGDDACVLNLNDGFGFGSEWSIKKHLSPFATRFCLKLINYGDGDMFNFQDETGARILPSLQGIEAPGTALGPRYSALLEKWRCTHTGAFSCNHVYSRTDSIWAAKYEAPYELHSAGFDARKGTFLPGYINYDAEHDEVDAIAPEPADRVVHDPAAFGDNWSESLEKEEKSAATAYFQRFDALHRNFGFINLRVGQADHFIKLRGPKKRGITFEAPRCSLMTAIRYNIFDDLLIGNFVKTTLHGGVNSLYPDFSPYVAKYGDNGLAYSEADLTRYFKYYRELYGLRHWLAKMEFDSVNKLRSALYGHPYRGAMKKLYHAIR